MLDCRAEVWTWEFLSGNVCEVLNASCLCMHVGVEGSCWFFGGVGLGNTYIRRQPVWRCGLVDVIVVVVCVGAALRGLPLPSANRTALHHAAAHLCRRLMWRLVRVTVLCYNPVGLKEKMKSSDLYLYTVMFTKCWGGIANPRRRRYHQAPSMRPPAQPPWFRVSQEMRFWGDSWGVMCPIDWMEIRSDATAINQNNHLLGKSLRSTQECSLFVFLFVCFCSSCVSSLQWCYLIVGVFNRIWSWSLTCSWESPRSSTVALIQRFVNLVGPLLWWVKVARQSIVLGIHVHL